MNTNMKLGFAIVVATVAIASFVMMGEGEIKYPEAHRVDQTDNYHGTMVTDPYRWMEDTESEEVQDWINAEEELLESYISENPLREAILKRIQTLGKTGKSYGIPIKRGDHYFYGIKDPEERFMIQYTQKGLEGDLKVVYDPNTALSETNKTNGGYSISPNGKYMAVRTRNGQSSFGDITILDIAKNKTSNEVIPGTANTKMVWNGNENGFYYINYGDTEDLISGNSTPFGQIKYYEVNTSIDADKIIFSNPDHLDWLYNIAVSQDNKYLVITVLAGSASKNMVYLKELKHPDSKVKPFLTKNDYAYTYLGSESDKFWFYTNNGAPKGRIIVIDVNHPDSSIWKEVIPEADEAIAGGSSQGGNAMIISGGKIVLLYRKGPVSFIKLFDLEGNLEKKLNLETGWIGSGLVGNWDGAEVWYSLTTFTAPTRVYRLDLNKQTSEPYFNLDLPINPDDYVTKHIFYKSKDGTKVPLFIAHKKNLKLDGNNPAFMYGYGYGGWVATPWYQPHMLTWLDMGGVYAMPGIRGGGEYGEEWRLAGIRLNRQNAIDDYLSAAEWLVENKYTSPKLMVANGWSASGSLAATSVMQRPDLFGAGLVGIPSLDLLRYHLFRPLKGWTRGYGSSEIKEEFDVLYSYSPLHIIKEGQCYPPILVTAGEKDETVPPQHGYKYVASMQYNQSCDNPIMLKIVRGAGHSFGTTTQQFQETVADELTFLSQVLGLEVKDDLSVY